MTVRPRADLVLCLVLLAACACGAARIELELYARNIDTVPIAVVPFRVSGVSMPLGDEPWRVIADDLAFSARFRVTRPTRADSAFFMQNNTAIYVGGECGVAENQVTIRCWLRDAASGELLLERSYRGGLGSLRSISHRFSDELVQVLLGERGIFGSRIVFVRQEGQAKNLFIMDYDGHNQRRLTSGKTLNIFPCFADSGTILWVSFLRGKPDIYRGSTAGGNGRIFIYGRHMSTSPAVSPIDGRIAWASSKPGNLEIFVADADATGARQVTFKSGIDTSPAWSPSGYQIAFTSDRAGGPQIYVMDADGSNARRLVPEGGWQDSPSWSPKGDRIAYTWQQGKFDIWTTASDGSDSRRVTSARGGNTYPNWSADGQHIVYYCQQGGRSDLYTVRPDGSESRRLTESGDASMPDWEHF